MVKVIKVGLLILASLLMGSIIMFLKDSSIIDVIAGSYFLVINAFLGIDLAGMLKKSSKLPVGKFKKMNYYKYTISLICMMTLFGLALYRKEAYNVQALAAISSFGSGGMLILGFFIAGLEGNKIASDSGNKDD